MIPVRPALLAAILVALNLPVASSAATGTAHTPAGSLRWSDAGWLLHGERGTVRLDLPTLETLAPVTAESPAIVAAADAETGALHLYIVEADGVRPQIVDFDPGFGIEGLCGAGGAETLVLFAGDGDGRWVQVRLDRTGDGDAWRARAVRTLHTGPDSELCALDPLSERVWFTEAGVGVWEYGAWAEAPAERRLLGHAPDFEPVALVAVAGGIRWLAADGAGGGPLPDGVIGLEAAVPPRAAVARTVTGPHPLTGENDATPARAVHPTVVARIETDTVARSGDAADDAALWVHPTNPARSLVLGTDKQSGLLVFDLDGRRLQHLAVGRVNNVDVRTSASAGGDAVAVATNRTHRSLSVFRIPAPRSGRRTPEVRLVDGETALDGLGDPYGVCLQRSRAGELRVFVNDTDGRVERHRLQLVDGRAHLELEAAMHLPSQPEGCVVDDARGLLWIGEEAVGVWRFPVDFESRADGALVIDAAATPLVPDVEGLARLRAADGTELLLVSSQGDDSYGLFDVTDAAASSAPWLGSVRIVADPASGIDGASETDGLELAGDDFGGRFPGGLMIVQDGRNRMPEAPQNFKLVAFADVLAALGVDLATP